MTVTERIEYVFASGIHREVLRTSQDSNRVCAAKFVLGNDRSNPTIAVSRFGSAVDFDLRAALKHFGLDPWKVKMEKLSDAHARPVAQRKPMVAFRARVGLLIPSTNVAAEVEFYTMAPQGVTFHFSRLDHPLELGIKKYEHMVKELATEVKKLTHAGVRVIGFACTTGSLYGGKGYNEGLEEQIREISGVPATSTSSAVLEALSFLKTKRLCVLTPYETQVNELEKKFLEANGFDVRFIGTIDTHGLRHSEIDEELLLEQVKKFGADDSDVVFLSCTGLPTVAVLARIESELRKPVISSNQATMWKLKNMVGLTEPIKGFGSLLETGETPSARGAFYASP